MKKKSGGPGLHPVCRLVKTALLAASLAPMRYVMYCYFRFSLEDDVLFCT